MYKDGNRLYVRRFGSAKSVNQIMMFMNVTVLAIFSKDLGHYNNYNDQNLAKTWAKKDFGAIQ